MECLGIPSILTTFLRLTNDAQQCHPERHRAAQRDVGSRSQAEALVLGPETLEESLPRVSRRVGQGSVVGVFC